MFQSTLKLKATAADILEIFAEQTHRSVVYNLRTRFVELLLVDQYLSRDNQCLCAFARGDNSPVNEKFVESQFHIRPVVEVIITVAWPSSCTPKVPALAPVQNAEPSLVESLTKIGLCFSTVFSTVVLKTSLFSIIRKK